MANAQDLANLLEKYWERILRKLGADPGTPMPPVVVSRDVDAAGQWNPSTGRIEVGAEYLKNADPDDLAGFIVHEGTHAAMPISGEQGRGAARQIEPIADAIRYELTGNAGGWTPSDEAKRLADLSPLELRYISTALATGNYSNQLLKAIEAGAVSREQMRTALGGGTASADGTYGEGSGDTSVDWTTGTGGSDGVPRGGAPGSGDGTGDGTWEPSGNRDRRQYKAAAIETYLNAWGIPMTPGIQELLAQAYQHEWTDNQFLIALRGTQEYRQRFPGMMDKDGTPKMSEADYMQEEKAFAAYASQHGINMSPQRMAWNFRNNVTSSEFNDRAEAFVRVKKNEQLYGSFKRELIQAGVAKPSEVNTNKELYKFVMGEGNAKWADLWQDSITRYQANQAGITIAKNRESYTNIAQKALERISSMGLSEEEMASRFVALSDVLGDVLPLQEAGLYGIKKKTAIAATFGGKGSKRARQQIERAVQTDEAFYDQRAGNAVYSDEQGGLVTQGVTDRSRQQQSEY